MDLWAFIINTFLVAGFITALLLLRLAHLAYRHTILINTPFHSAVNIAIILQWMLLVMELSPLSNPVSDYGAPTGFVLMLVGIPLCYVISWFLRRGEASAPVKSYVMLSRVLWGIQLIPGALILFFWYAWASGR
jgi:Zn-dependent protease with chaperone function